MRRNPWDRAQAAAVRQARIDAGTVANDGAGGTESQTLAGAGAAAQGEFSAFGILDLTKFSDGFRLAGAATASPLGRLDSTRFSDGFILAPSGPGQLDRTKFSEGFRLS